MDPTSDRPAQTVSLRLNVAPADRESKSESTHQFRPIPTCLIVLKKKKKKFPSVHECFVLIINLLEADLFHSKIDKNSRYLFTIDLVKKIYMLPVNFVVITTAKKFRHSINLINFSFSSFLLKCYIILRHASAST